MVGDPGYNSTQIENSEGGDDDEGGGGGEGGSGGEASGGNQFLRDERENERLVKEYVKLHGGGMCLHAEELSFIHPVTGVMMKFVDVPPF